MPLFSKSTTYTWERMYRSNFVNSLTGFKSVSLIETGNEKGLTNLGVFSSIVHIETNPPLIGFINRPETGDSYNLSNIRSTGVYTLNHIQSSVLEQAHQTSAKYPAGLSELEEVGLMPKYVEHITVSFVKESKIEYALSLEEIIPIHLNATCFVIGTIQCVLLEEKVLLKDGFLELDNAASICSNGNDAYYATQLTGRYPYSQSEGKTTNT